MGALWNLFAAVYGLIMILCLGLGLVWFYFSIRFFNRASEYYRREMDYFKKRDEDMKELLVKFDQLVDVLKVK